MQKVYINEVLLPVAPPSIDIKIGRNSKTYQLINGSEISVPGKQKLTEISFSILLPNQEYSFAVYEDGYKPAEHFLTELYKMTSAVSLKIPGMFQAVREKHFTIDDIAIKEETGSEDVTVKLKLKEFSKHSAKAVDLSALGVVLKKRRISKNAPLPVEKPKAYTAKEGDTVWSIAKKNYGDEDHAQTLLEAFPHSRIAQILAGQMITLPRPDFTKKSRGKKDERLETQLEDAKVAVGKIYYGPHRGDGSKKSSKRGRSKDLDAFKSKDKNRGKSRRF